MICYRVSSNGIESEKVDFVTVWLIKKMIMKFITKQANDLCRCSRPSGGEDDSLELLLKFYDVLIGFSYLVLFI